MTAERMELLLYSHISAETINNDRVQLMSPGLMFTCDGVITKWILGIKMEDDDEHQYPELQVWRRSNDEFIKINGTVIINEQPYSHGSKHILSYANFDPIPIKRGDIFGAFVPDDNDARFSLQMEDTDSPINYYLSTGISDSSNYQLIHTLDDVDSNRYHLIVSAEIGRYFMY